MRHLVFVLLAGLVASPAVAQTPGPAFEVASIKPSQAARLQGFGITPGGQFTAQGANVADLIGIAYGMRVPLRRFQITGGPGWIDSARFDIQAKSTVVSPTPEQVSLLIRSLLVDRFKLAAREETRDAPIYELKLARSDGQLGPKMTRSSLPFTCFQAGAPAPPPEQMAQCVYNIGYGVLKARGVPVQTLAYSIPNFYGIGRSVVDRTGLTGGYDMDMEWAPMTQFIQPGNLAPPPDAADRPVNNGPSIFVALREQLGLALEPSRGPVPMVVIDRVEKPSDN